jgi:hypothetical protein
LPPETKEQDQEGGGGSDYVAVAARKAPESPRGDAGARAGTVFCWFMVCLTLRHWRFGAP